MPGRVTSSATEVVCQEPDEPLPSVSSGTDGLDGAEQLSYSCTGFMARDEQKHWPERCCEACTWGCRKKMDPEIKKYVGKKKINATSAQGAMEYNKNVVACVWVAIQSTHMERRERMKQSSSQTRNCVP